MSINYDWYSIPKKNADDKDRLHVRPAFNGSISTDDIAESIQTATSLTKADVLAVLKALNQEMSRQIANGCRIHLEGVGYFSPRLTVEGEVSEEMPLRDRNRKVRFAGVNYSSDKRLIDAIGAVQLTHTQHAGHSQMLTDEELDRQLTNFFATHHFLTRQFLQQCCGLMKGKATAVLRQLREEGKLQNIGTDHQPVYVPAPGHYGR